MRRGKLPIYESVLVTTDVFNTFRPEFSLHEFESLIRKYGFVNSWDRELLISRYFYGLSFRSIADEQHYVSYQTVRRRLKELHKLLKERGYGGDLDE
jgi:hypothetical protein